MHNKDFKGWLARKEDIHGTRERLFFHERDIWFVSMGVNIGFEQDGKGVKFLRPAIVLKKFNNQILWCIPLTKNNKMGKYYFSFYFNNKNSVAILSQIRLIDAKRLRYKVGMISQDDFMKLKEKIRLLLA